MRKASIGLAMAALAALISFADSRANEDQILQALREEMARSTTRLSLPDYVKPYFIAYRLTETEGYVVTATLGALLHEGGGKERKLYVEVRVGDYAFDNTSTRSENDRFDPDLDTFNYLQYTNLPIEDDVDAMRARLWRLTDLRFKNALADYLRKKAQAVYRENADARLPDFARQAPVKRLDPPLVVTIDKAAWKAIARDASAVLKQYPEILDANVTLQTQLGTRWLLTSEGTELATRGFYFSFNVDAAALADDGMTVRHYYSRYARTPAGMPTRDEILAGVKEMAEQLTQLRRAPAIEPYAGPALLDPSVAGIFFHEAIGHRLEGNRTRGVDEGQTFKGQLGQPILPAFLDIADDPTLARYAGVDLNGTYDFDEEGVPAQRVELVSGGVLRDFLRSRMPILDFRASNGHGRADATRAPMSRMSNLIVHARRTAPAAKLRAMLLALAREKGKPYALRLRTGISGETSTDQFNFQAFANRPVLLSRIDVKTGREELVRGAELVGTPLLSISKIVAAGDDVGVFNGYCGAESGFVAVSASAPSVLIGEIELQRVQDKPTKPPILPPPYAPPNK
jgi:predicted Zn-dependent protease